MTSHANCTHAPTKSARAACRKNRAQVEVEVPAYEPYNPRKDASLTIEEKASLVRNPFDYETLYTARDGRTPDRWESDHPYMVWEGYLDNACMTDSAEWTKDLTSDNLASCCEAEVDSYGFDLPS